MGKVIPILALVVFAGRLGAQDLGGLGSLDQVKPLAPAAPVTAAPKVVNREAPKATKEEVTGTSAHYALADVDAYITEIAGKLAILNRPKDPFGINADPTAEVAPIVADGPEPVVQIEAKVPFADIINSLRVTAIMPAEKQFLIGSRAIREGDTLPLAIPEGTVLARVLAVRPGEILFENTADKTTATLQNKIMPKGMIRGHGSLEIPGLQPDSPNAPIKVDLRLIPSDTPPR